MSVPPSALCAKAVTPLTNTAITVTRKVTSPVEQTASLTQNTPLKQPTAHHYLAYAGLGTVGSLVGATAGFGYKTFSLPLEAVPFNTHWQKANKVTQDIALDTTLSTGESIRWHANLGRTPFAVIFGNDDTLNKLTILQPRILLDSTCQEERPDKIIATSVGIVVTPHPNKTKLVNHYLYIHLNKDYALIGDTLEAQNHNTTAIKATHCIKVENNQHQSIMPPLAPLWKQLTEQHQDIHTIHQELQKAGYSITKLNTPETLPLPQEWLAHGSWESVVKAAVKHPEDAWKLIPQEGMAKFVGGGTAIGLAVVGAGIGAYEALKPKPTQPQ